jgi:hypothetical protein
MPDATLLDKYPVGSSEWCWLNGTGDMKESAELSGLSKDSLRRNHPDKILRLGPRRVGMKPRIAQKMTGATLLPNGGHANERPAET